MRDIRNEVLEGEPVVICDRSKLELAIRLKCYEHINGFSTQKILGDLKKFNKGDDVKVRLGRDLPTQEEIDLFLGGMPLSENHLSTLSEFFGIYTRN